MTINFARRKFIAALGAAAVVWPLAARAQQTDRVRRIGVAMSLASDDPEGHARLRALLDALQQLGWTVGRNLQIDYRWGSGDADHDSRDAAELVSLAPDVILATGNSTLKTLLLATRIVPIVFVQVTDPVGAGMVKSMVRPGGNATGFSSLDYGTSGKWLKLLKEIAPNVTRVAVLCDNTSNGGIFQWDAIDAEAPSIGVELHAFGIPDAAGDRAHNRRVRAQLEWWPDRDGERPVDHSSRPNHRASSPVSLARNLSLALLRHRRRPDVLRA